MRQLNNLMAFTNEQLVALDSAISQGVLKVKYSDKEVTFRSLSDMLKLRDMMLRELGQGSSTRKFAVFNKGLGSKQTNDENQFYD
jgi:hypothetical protein